MSPQGLFDLPSTRSKLQLDQTDQIRLKIEHFISLSISEMGREPKLLTYQDCVVGHR